MKKCLFVDDVPLNILLAQKILSTFNMEVAKAANGKEACDYIREGNQPDIMIMDLMMPIMNGFEVIEEIRSGKCGNPDMPIIVVSALSHQEDIQRALDLGANGFVTKPIMVPKLKAAVKEILGDFE